MKVKTLSAKLGIIPEECKKCKVRNDLTIDHKIPKAVMNFFGLSSMADDINNLQILCQKCNTLKGSTLELDDPNLEKILIRLLRLGKKYHKVEEESLSLFDNL